MQDTITDEEFIFWRMRCSKRSNVWG
jgi:hypothetical protein